MFKRLIASLVCLTFSFTNLQYVHAQDFSINQLPVPGTMVGESVPFAPLALKGLIVNPQKPLEFQFIVDTGKGPQDTASIKEEANQLVKYFLAGLTIPEGDLWVNLSPYEKDRMVPTALGQTDLGRDLLAQDYILKQLTVSLIYPEKDLGKEFWSRVYAKAQEQFGTTNIPVNTFNKVWILPNEAQVFENNNAAYVTKSTLKVMLDEDYLAKQKHESVQAASISSQIVRQIILPEIEKEVNTGKNFAPLRQIYQALILAKWYKETIQNGLLDAVYTNKNKVAGVNLADPAVKEQIYERYLKAYKKGAFNYIKEDPTPDGRVVPRKYFSGGLQLMPRSLREDGSEQDVESQKPDGAMVALDVELDSAMLNQAEFEAMAQVFGNRYAQSINVAKYNRAITPLLTEPPVNIAASLNTPAAISALPFLEEMRTIPRYGLLDVGKMNFIDAGFTEDQWKAVWKKLKENKYIEEKTIKKTVDGQEIGEPTGIGTVQKKFYLVLDPLTKMSQPNGEWVTVFGNDSQRVYDFLKHFRYSILDHSTEIIDIVNAAGSANVEAFNKGSVSAEPITKELAEKYKALYEPLSPRQKYLLNFFNLFHDLMIIVQTPIHPEAGAVAIKPIMEKLEFSQDEIILVSWLIGHHADLGPMYTGERSPKKLISAMEELPLPLRKTALSLLALETLGDADTVLTKVIQKGDNFIFSRGAIVQEELARFYLLVLDQLKLNEVISRFDEYRIIKVASGHNNVVIPERLAAIRAELEKIPVVQRPQFYSTLKTHIETIDYGIYFLRTLSPEAFVKFIYLISQIEAQHNNVFDRLNLSAPSAAYKPAANAVTSILTQFDLKSLTAGSPRFQEAKDALLIDEDVGNKVIKCDNLTLGQDSAMMTQSLQEISADLESSRNESIETIQQNASLVFAHVRTYLEQANNAFAQAKALPEDKVEAKNIIYIQILSTIQKIVALPQMVLVESEECKALRKEVTDLWIKLGETMEQRRVDAIKTLIKGENVGNVLEKRMSEAHIVFENGKAKIEELQPDAWSPYSSEIWAPYLVDTLANLIRKTDVNLNEQSKIILPEKVGRLSMALVRNLTTSVDPTERLKQFVKIEGDVRKDPSKGLQLAQSLGWGEIQKREDFQHFMQDFLEAMRLMKWTENWESKKDVVLKERQQWFEQIKTKLGLNDLDVKVFAARILSRNIPFDIIEQIANNHMARGEEYRERGDQLIKKGYLRMVSMAGGSASRWKTSLADLINKGLIDSKQVPDNLPRALAAFWTGNYIEGGQTGVSLMLNNLALLKNQGYNSSVAYILSPYTWQDFMKTTYQTYGNNRNRPKVFVIAQNSSVAQVIKDGTMTDEDLPGKVLGHGNVRGWLVGGVVEGLKNGNVFDLTRSADNPFTQLNQTQVKEIIGRMAADHLVHVAVGNWRSIGQSGGGFVNEQGIANVIDTPISNRANSRGFLANRDINIFSTLTNFINNAAVLYAVSSKEDKVISWAQVEKITEGNPEELAGLQKRLEQLTPEQIARFTNNFIDLLPSEFVKKNEGKTFVQWEQISGMLHGALPKAIHDRQTRDGEPFSEKLSMAYVDISRADYRTLYGQNAKAADVKGPIPMFLEVKGAPDLEEAMGEAKNTMDILASRGIFDFKDHAMPADKAALVKPSDLGGIDLNQINILRQGKTVNVQFDQAQLTQLEQGGFEGFTPVIINMTRISSPFQLLGINPAKEPEALAKV